MIFLTTNLEKKIKLQQTTSDAISSAASQVVKTVQAKVIFTYTRSGETAKRAARERPTVPIIGLISRKTNR